MPQNAAIRIDDARDAFLNGDLDTAERLSLQILSVSKSDVPSLHLLGAIALHRNNLADARNWFEMAVSAGTDDAVLYSNLGETYRRLGENEEALRCLEYSLKRNNADIAPHFNLAMLYRSVGEPRLAEHFFRNVLLLDPKMGRAHRELAELYREEGHFTEAIAEYQAAIDVLRTFGDQERTGEFSKESYWRLRLGSLAREFGSTFWAIDILRAAISLDADNSDAHRELARCMFEMCWESEALSYCSLKMQHRQSASIGRMEYLATKVESPKEWCERRGEQYVCLARAQTLSLPEFQTIPAAAKTGFLLGEPVTTELFLANVPSAVVLPDQLAIVSGDSRLLLDGVVNTPQSYLQNGESVIHASDDLRVLLELPLSQFEIRHRCAVLGGGGDHYSWMFESLARMWALEQHPEYETLRIVIPENLSDARREMLGAIGVGRDKIINWPAGSRLSIAQLVVPSLMVIGQWASPIGLQYLRRKLAHPHRGKPRRVFLSRSTAAHSRLKNQTEILPRLLQHGFEVVNCVETSPMQLIAILSEATVVIGCDDETLANLVVTPLGAKVGVIVSNGAYRLRSYFVCAQLGHSLTYLLAQPDFETHAVHSLCDFNLEPKLLDQFFRTLPAG